MELGVGGTTGGEGEAVEAVGGRKGVVVHGGEGEEVIVGTEGVDLEGHGDFGFGRGGGLGRIEMVSS